MATLQIQQLLERIASVLRSETRSQLLAYGLQPVQFEALHYLSICNRYSDTPMSVSEYLGQTKGSVSQTLKVLEKKGFLSKTSDNNDKRVAHMEVTNSGRELIDSILPSPLLTSAGRQLGQQNKLGGLEERLYELLKGIQHANGLRTFGQCSTCSHFIKRAASKHVCGLTNESLTPAETRLICREHEPRK